MLFSWTSSQFDTRPLCVNPSFRQSSAVFARFWFCGGFFSIPEIPSHYVFNQHSEYIRDLIQETKQIILENAAFGRNDDGDVHLGSNGVRWE